MGCHFLLQGIFPTQGLNPVSCISGRFFIVWTTREACRRHRWNYNSCFPGSISVSVFLFVSLSVNIHTHIKTHTHTHTRVLSLCCCQFTDIGMAVSLRWSLWGHGPGVPFFVFSCINLHKHQEQLVYFESSEPVLAFISTCFILFDFIWKKIINEKTEACRERSGHMPMVTQREGTTNLAWIPFPFLLTL